MSVVVEELLQHVQHACHLGEDEHPVASRLQPPQKRVEGLQLACKHTLAHLHLGHLADTFPNTGYLQV